MTFNVYFSQWAVVTVVPGDKAGDEPQLFYCQPDDDKQVGEEKVLYLLSNGRGFFCPLVKAGAAECLVLMSTLKDSLDDCESYADEVISVLPPGPVVENFKRIQLCLAAAVHYSSGATRTALTAESALIPEFVLDKAVQALPSMQLSSQVEGRKRRALKTTGTATAPPPTKIERKDSECYCGKQCADGQSLEEHIKTDHKDNWGCSICDQVLSGGAALWKHVRCTHRQLYLYKCEYCQFGSDTWAAIPKHISIHHKDQEAGEMVTCPKCCATFSSKSSLTRHLPGCGHSDKQFMCAEQGCGKEFRSKANLLSHMEGEHKDNKKSCPYCKNKYVHLASLNTHIVAAHPKSKKGLALSKKKK